MTDTPSIPMPEIDAETFVRVSYGARVLDGLFAGWETLIDLDTLDMGYGYRCVLGQITATVGNDCCFSCAAEYFNLHEEQLIRMGLYIAQASENSTLSKEYQQLDSLWKAEILQRRDGLKVTAEGL